jgi:GMP synthase (glutamine-hydrolysing)
MTPEPPAGAAPGRRVLVVQHEPGAPAGWFGLALRDAGCHLVLATPYDGSALPALDGFDGLVVLGGSVDSWDEQTAPWLPATRALVRRAEHEGVPTLGICLGHQIAAAALGGRAGRNPAGRTVRIESVGWLPAAAADPLLAGSRGATRALHWNRDVVLDLPSGATVLARSDDGAVQAARLGGHVWGVQSHPEVDARIVTDWWHEEQASTGTAPRPDIDALLGELRSLEDELARDWTPLADGFSRLVHHGLDGAT